MLLKPLDEFSDNKGQPSFAKAMEGDGGLAQLARVSRSKTGRVKVSKQRQEND